MDECIFSLRGRTAVVIGGTAGIGRAIAIGLAKGGADVVPASRRLPEVEQTATEIEAMGRRTLALRADVSRRESLQALHDQTMQAFGRIDILVNSAGITKRTPTLHCAEEEWERIMETNLTGTFRACQIFGRTMVAQQYGRIVNVASLGSILAFQEVAAYCASKAGIAALTRSLAIEWAQHGVCVNAIAPGIVPTSLNSQLLNGTGRGKEMLMRIPMKRFASPEEMVGAAVFLSSAAASYITGQLIPIDGGYLASGVNQ